MSLKKNLKIGQTAQASLEYFILFALIAGLTLISAKTFLPNVLVTMQGTQTEKGLFQKAVDRIVK